MNAVSEPRWHAWGPLEASQEADALVASLRRDGVPAAALGIVPLGLRVGVEQHPIECWLLGRAGRGAVRMMAVSLPLLLAVYAGVFLLTLDDPSSLLVSLGLVGALGATPIAGLIGFALEWHRWSPLTRVDATSLPSKGFLVAGVGPRVAEAARAGSIAAPRFVPARRATRV